MLDKFVDENGLCRNEEDGVVLCKPGMGGKHQKEI